MKKRTKNTKPLAVGKPVVGAHPAATAPTGPASGYRPIEFDCGEGVTVRLCPDFISVVGNKPEYWYIRKPLHSWDDRALWTKGFRTCYWAKGGWSHTTPLQFPSAEEAMQFHRTHLADND